MLRLVILARFCKVRAVRMSLFFRCLKTKILDARDMRIGRSDFSEFFSYDEIHSHKRRTNISAALTNDSYNLYSKEASLLLKLSNIYLFMGTEADGLPDRIVEVSKNVEIPSLSSSIKSNELFLA